MPITKERLRLQQLGEWLDREVAGDASQSEWDATVAEYTALGAALAAVDKEAERAQP